MDIVRTRRWIASTYPVSKGCTSPFAPIWIKAMAAGKAERTPPDCGGITKHCS
jgi:hypothetical protein